MHKITQFETRGKEIEFVNDNEGLHWDENQSDDDNNK